VAEVDLMRTLNHPNIVQLVDFFESDTDYNLVLELMEGGELFERLIEKEAYTEKEAQEFAISFLRTIKHLHDQDIVHRDIKPENLLMKSKTDDVTVKLADFGFAVRLGGNIINKNAGNFISLFLKVSSVLLICFHLSSFLHLH
jgi:calcium/calmodulin-dependent protein kinase I